VNHVQVIVLVWCEIEKQPIGQSLAELAFGADLVLDAIDVGCIPKRRMPIGTIKLQPLVSIYASSCGGCVGGTK
jgi:hypothetical protein